MFYFWTHLKNQVQNKTRQPQQKENETHSANDVDSHALPPLALSSQ